MTIIIGWQVPRSQFSCLSNVFEAHSAHKEARWYHRHLGPTSFANARDATSVSVSRSHGPRYFLNLVFKRKKYLSYYIFCDLPKGTLC